MTAPPNDRDDSKVPSSGTDVRSPVLFTVGIILLWVSVLAFVAATGSGSTGPVAGSTSATTGVTFWLALYVWFIVRVAGGRPKARIAVTILALVLYLFVLGVAYGPEGLGAYFVGVGTSAAGVVLLYLPQSGSYITMREAGRASRSASQTELVRRLFEERGEDGERVHTLSDIAARLGMSRTTAYRHLDTDQQRQLRQSQNER